MSPNTIASLTTAAGTLVLAVATFSSTRSANRASRIAERSLLAALRPVLVHGQIGDPMQKIGFADDHWVRVEGPRAIFDVTADAIYFAFGLRNVGSGIAILQAWYPTPQRILSADPHAPVDQFRAQSRALYVPPGGLGFWQGALREPGEEVFEEFVKAASNRAPITIDLLYSDMNGGQRTITRISVLPVSQKSRQDAATADRSGTVTGDAEPAGVGREGWVASIGRHWLIEDEAQAPAGQGNGHGATGAARLARWGRG